MTKLLESTIIEKVKHFEQSLVEKENAALATIEFNENEIERLNAEYVAAESRYLMDRSTEARQKMDDTQKQIETAKAEIQLESRFLANSSMREGSLCLVQSEIDTLLKELNKFVKPLATKQAEIEKKSQELLAAFEAYKAEFFEIDDEIDSAYSLIMSNCGKTTAREVIGSINGFNPGEVKSNLKELAGKLTDFEFRLFF